MLTFLVALTAMSQDPPKLPVNVADLKPYTLLIFERGEGREKYTQDQLEEMQKGHIANLVRIYKEKKASAAGPFGDDGNWRGIVILDLPKDKVPTEFTQDPFVKAGLLKTKLYTWVMHKDSMAWPQDDLGMAEYTFVMLKKGSTWNPEQGSKLMVPHLEHNIKMSKEGKLGLVGPMDEKDNDWVGTFIFYGKDQEAIKKDLEQDPMIKVKHLTYEMKPLWMSKGLFKQPY